MDLESLNSVLKVGVLVGGICAVGALITETIINSRQSAVIRGMNQTLAEQRERAANAERALLELRERTLPRRLSVAQREQVADMLKSHTQGAMTITVRTGEEARNFGDDLALAIQAAGWAVSREGFEVVSGQALPTGLQLLAPEDRDSVATADVFRKALKAVGYDAKTPEPGSVGTPGRQGQLKTIVLKVWGKP